MQIQQSSIRNLLQEEGSQNAFGKVKSESLAEEMTLIGFVPFCFPNIHLQFSLLYDLNDRLIVTPYLIRFGTDKLVLPIYKHIQRANGKKYIFDANFFIDTIIEKASETKLPEIKKRWPLSGPLLKNLLPYKYSNTLLQTDGGITYYIGKEDEWELSNGPKQSIYISNDFLCLCTYMNHITGLPSYTLLRPDDAIRILIKNVENLYI